MSELNRYQNPEIFEKLAMSYAAGTLHGRARRRFEALKQQHFYLEATTNAYESKFGSLIELLPSEKPSDQVWKNIESSIMADIKQTTPKTEKRPWFSWFKQSYAFALMALLVATLVVVNPFSEIKEAVAYTAVFEADDKTPLAITRITHDDLSVSVDIVKDIPIEDGTVLKLWCHPKKGGKPVMMGEISSTGRTILKIDAKEWENMKTVGMLEISAETPNYSASPMTKKTILLGQLNPITDNK